jgi:predicted nuclease of predicted toxin-antitoxin system
VSPKRPTLKLFIDEGVPDSVGRAFLASGHKVVYLRDAIATGSPDQLVCAVSEANDAILVALDGDMRQLAQRHGIGQRRYRKLSLLKLSCRETRAAARVVQAMSLIEHEWNYSAGSNDRRIFIEINDEAMHTKR